MSVLLERLLRDRRQGCQHGFDRTRNGRLDRGRASLAEGKYIFGLDCDKSDVVTVRESPACRPNAKAVDRFTSWAEALRWVGMPSAANR